MAIDFKSIEDLDEVLGRYSVSEGCYLHLCSGKLFGGIEKMLLTIAKNHQQNSSPRHQFIYCNEGIFSANLGMFDKSVYCVGPTKIRNPISLIKSQIKFSQLIDNIKPSLVILHDSWAQLIFGKTIIKKNIIFVRMIHSLADVNSGFIERLAWRNKPDYCIANSKATKKSFESANSDLTCVVCYPPFILYDPSTREKRRAVVREQMKVNKKSKIILTAGRFEKYKGHEVLLKALAMLPREKAWECWIAGDSQLPKEEAYKKKLKFISNNLGISSRLRWLGHIDHMEDYYAGADVYCQPNISPESFGMTFVEAQAMRCPVITTAFGGALETVEKGEPNFLLDKPSPERVQIALKSLLGI